MAQEQFTLVPSGLSVRLHLDGPLDRESVDLYNFRIFVTDRGMPALIGEARIYIIVTVSCNKFTAIFFYGEEVGRGSHSRLFASSTFVQYKAS